MFTIMLNINGNIAFRHSQLKPFSSQLAGGRNQATTAPLDNIVRQHNSIAMPSVRECLFGNASQSDQSLGGWGEQRRTKSTDFPRVTDVSHAELCRSVPSGQ